MDLYVTYYSADYVTRVILDTLTRIGALDLTPGGGGAETEDCVIYGDYLILGRWTGVPSGQLIRIDLRTFTEVAPRLDLPEQNLGSGSPHRCLRIVGNILYIAIDRPAPGVNGGIVRVNLDTFTRIDRLDLPVRWPRIETDGTYLYVGYFIGTRFDRIELVGFTIDSTIVLTNTDVMATYVYGNYLYLTHSVSPDRVTRIALATFTEGPNVPFIAGENWGYSLISDGTYLYCGLASAPGNPGVIVRLTLAPFARVDALTLPLVPPWASAERDIWNLYLYGGFLWALCESNPTNIVKIDPTTFTRDSGLQLNVGELDAWAGALFAPVPAIPFRMNKAYALSREEL